MPTFGNEDYQTVYISTADGKVWQAFEGIKEALITGTNEIQDFIFDNLEFTGTLKINKETMAKLRGFKNYNCYCRYIRRKKRIMEQQRRRRLKQNA